MADCYICGAPNAHNRREVHTGSSSGWYFSRRLGFSSREYSGVRSVCDDCARRIDGNPITKLISYVIVGLLIWYFFFHNTTPDPATKAKIEQELNTSFSKPHYLGKVNAKDGLILRLEPRSKSEVVFSIPYEEQIEIITDTVIDKQKWMQTTYAGNSGWVNSKYVDVK